MKKRGIRNILIGVILGLGLAFETSARIWTSADGRKVEAELKEHNASTGELTLMRKNGREFSFNVSALSDADKKYLESLQKERDRKEKERVAKEKKLAETAAALAGTTASYITSGRNKLSYHCYYPKSYSGEIMPILILFSPNGNGRSIMKRFTPVGDEHNWLIVGCDKFKNGLENDECEEWFKEVLPAIEKTIPLNPDRMYLGGMSGGALRAYQYSAMFDRPWKGIVACGGWLGGTESGSLKYAKKMAVAMVNGDQDGNANNWIEHDKSELKSRSCKVEVFHFPGGHTIGPSETLSEAVAWIIENTYIKK